MLQDYIRYGLELAEYHLLESYDGVKDKTDETDRVFLESVQVCFLVFLPLVFSFQVCLCLTLFVFRVLFHFVCVSFTLCFKSISLMNLPGFSESIQVYVSVSFDAFCHLIGINPVCVRVELQCLYVSRV